MTRKCWRCGRITDGARHVERERTRCRGRVLRCRIVSDGETEELPEHRIGQLVFVELDGCERCGGSGYYDGERLDMRCPCTGMKQRDVRPRRPRVGDPGFAYRGRQI